MRAPTALVAESAPVLTFGLPWAAFIVTLYVPVGDFVGISTMYAALVVPLVAPAGILCLCAFQRRRRTLALDRPPDSLERVERLSWLTLALQSTILVAITVLLCGFHDQFVMYWLPAFYRAIGVRGV